MPEPLNVMYLQVLGGQLRGCGPLSADQLVDVRVDQVSPPRDGWCEFAGVVYTDEDLAGRPVHHVKVRAEAVQPAALPPPDPPGVLQ